MAASLAAPLFAGAQPAPRLPRVALVLVNPSLADMQGPKAADGLTQEFIQRLRQLGYVEGRTIAIERRAVEGQLERLSGVMEELVELRVDVIVTLGAGATAARRATSTIPIVAYVEDPVGQGFTASLSRPTQNVTGMAFTSSGIIGKRLQLLKLAAPKSERVAVIDFKYVDAKATPSTHRRRLAAEAAARDLGLTLITAGVSSADDLDQAFAVIDRERADALLDMGTSASYVNRRAIVDFAAQRRLPAMYGCRPCVEDGGLMFYGSNSGPAEHFANYVDKILRGAKPVDLPFQEPTTYELVINLKTAAQLGLTIPESLLLVAEVIK